jgi:hypothetical protein
MTTRLLATGTILLAIGLTLAEVVAEWFAAFDSHIRSAWRSGFRTPVGKRCFRDGAIL